MAAVAAGSGAADGGPGPGAVVGWDGIEAPGGLVRYVALPGSTTRTTVAAVRIKGGRIALFTSVRGVLGIPQVALDGTMGGLSANGRRLVLASTRGAGGNSTTFVVLTRTLGLVNSIRLPGLWSYDAISPDGRMIFAIQYGTTAADTSYRVRVIDVASGRVHPGAIVDKRDPEVMRGSPVTRAEAAGTAFTLYVRADGTAFVHALDTRRATAACVHLPWPPNAGNGIWNVRLAVAGGVLRLRQQGAGTLASVDLRTLGVRSFRRPVST
jgi:hypothetical protein